MPCPEHGITDQTRLTEYSTVGVRKRHKTFCALRRVAPMHLQPRTSFNYTVNETVSIRVSQVVACGGGNFVSLELGLSQAQQLSTIKDAAVT